MKLILVPTLHPKLTLWVSAAGLMTARQGADASGSDTLAMPPCCVRVFGSGGYRRRAIGCEIVAPQSDGEGDDSEPGYNDCPRLGTKPLEPLCVELDRAENRCGGDDPTAVGTRRPSPNGDDDDHPTED